MYALAVPILWRTRPPVRQQLSRCRLCKRVLASVGAVEVPAPQRRPQTPLPPSARTNSKRSETRLVPLNTDLQINTNPLEHPFFLRGLQSAGYLQPLDISRKTIQRRFMHALKKEEASRHIDSLSCTTEKLTSNLQFQANLEAFLEQHELKARGQFMVRFRGPATGASWQRERAAERPPEPDSQSFCRGPLAVCPHLHDCAPTRE